MGSKRYALLMCGEDSEYLVKMHGGTYGVFMKLLQEQEEKWDLYKLVQGEFPEQHDLPLYDGFVISGSCYDAHANDPWILDLIALVIKLDSMHKKILGICFGHQVQFLMLNTSHPYQSSFGSSLVNCHPFYIF